MKPSIFKQETNQAMIDEALNRTVPKVLDYLTECLGDDEFMVGGAFSIADIALTTPFVNFAIAGERVDAERWPQIAAYVERIHSLPCYAPIVAGDHPGQ
ncbi:MAG: glutathione S-transferase family protein [Deltaproteobacteria bacterium]|nr:glutathione S-transferase family protein [Deltaproteobacteria bacterium]